MIVPAAGPARPHRAPALPHAGPRPHAGNQLPFFDGSVTLVDMSLSPVRHPVAGWTTRVGQRRDLIAWAADESWRLLANLPDRWTHTQEVAMHAWWAAAGLPPHDQQLLVAAAYLHDIGYAQALSVTGFHPLDGAGHLANTGHPDLARLVAHHSGAAVEARHRGLTRQMAAFPPLPGPVADALTYCDATTGPRGESVDPGPRLEEIVDRHGPTASSPAPESKPASTSTRRRAHAAPGLRRPAEASSGSASTPCSSAAATLIRPTRRLLLPDAPQVSRQAVTRAVDDGEHPPHSLIIDGAQVDRRDSSAARRPPSRHWRDGHCGACSCRPREHVAASTQDENSGNDLVIDWTTDIERALTPQCSCP